MKYRIMKHVYTYGTPKVRATGHEGEQAEMLLLAAELQAQPWQPAVIDERRPIFTVEPVPEPTN